MRHWFGLGAMLATGLLTGVLLERGVGDRPAEGSGAGAAAPAPSDADGMAASPWPAHAGVTGPSDVDPASFAALVQRMGQEVAERQHLADQIAALQAQVAHLEATLDEATGPAGADSAGQPVTQRPEPRSQSERLVGQAALLDAGFEAHEAARIQGRLDQVELEQLYLRDRATREGWVNTSRFHRERNRLRATVDSMRDELGADSFDRLLFAVGRHNRVVARDVMQGSPAEQSGLAAGDVILSFDGKRVFSASGLQAATTQGDTGSLTLVEVIRGGDRLYLYIPRGPLGVRLGSVRIRP